MASLNRFNETNGLYSILVGISDLDWVGAFFWRKFMIEDILIIIGVCVIVRYLCQKINIPPLLAYLLMGMILGPYGLSWMSQAVLGQAADIKRMALAIILIRAGLTLNLKELKSVGPVALRMSFIPASFEIVASTLLGYYLLQMSWLEAFVLGVIIAAVSPAVVVPRMIHLIEEGLGLKAKVPQIILAGSSLDDIYTLVLFSMALLFYQQGQVSLQTLLTLPVSIMLGTVLGVLLAKLIQGWTQHLFTKVFVCLVLIFWTSLLCLQIEVWTHQWVSGLLAVIFFANQIKNRTDFPLKEVKHAFNNFWLIAEMFLFFLVGAILPFEEVTRLGFWPYIFILVTSMWRMVGVWLSLSGSQLILKEKVFVLGAYLPKATVQAAIGSIPLSMGMPAGKLIFTLSVIEILVTAPFGAWWIDRMKNPLLASESKQADI